MQLIVSAPDLTSSFQFQLALESLSYMLFYQWCLIGLEVMINKLFVRQVIALRVHRKERKFSCVHKSFKCYHDGAAGEIYSCR